MSNRRSIADFPRNEAGLVDGFIGTAFDAVYQIYLNLEEVLNSKGYAARAELAQKLSIQAQVASEAAATASSQSAKESAQYAAKAAESLAASITASESAAASAELAEYWVGMINNAGGETLQNALRAERARDASQAYATDAAASAQQTDADRIKTAEIAEAAASVAKEAAEVATDLKLVPVKEDIAEFKNDVDLTFKKEAEEVSRRSRQSLTQMPTFRKKVKANLPLKTRYYTDQKAVQFAFNGTSTEFYPQGFCVDWERRELFILRKGSIVLIEVYDWDTLILKTSFFTKSDVSTYTTASSEQPVILTVDGKRKLFTKGVVRKITQFDIDVLPENLSAVVMEASFDVNVYTSFAHKNGTWFVEDASYPVMDGVYRKTRYIKYDSAFNRVGEAEISAHVAGLDDALTDCSSRVSKKQGMCIAMGGIFFGVGGRRSGTADVYDYRHQGIRFLNGAGDVMQDSTVQHSGALSILQNNGVVCEFIENEGVQVDDTLGNVYGLYACLDEVSPDADRGGILILQEFCADEDAIDFTKVAAFNTFHNTRLLSGLAAKSTGNNYFNPISGEQFTNWPQICKYMFETDREIYAFDSSVSSIKLPDGTNLTSGLKVKIENYNGKTFFARGIGLYQDRQFRLVWDNAGNHLFLEYEARAYKNKLPFADGGVNLGQADFRWNNIFAINGTINTSDGREKTAPITISDEVLDAWGDVELISFQWLSSVKEKGEDLARWHFGVIAQQVRDVFLARNMDGTKLGLLCYDEWDETPETLDSEGQVIEPAQKAGNRWGIRADQCLFLEAAYQRRKAEISNKRIDLLEKRLLLLENAAKSQ